MSEEQVPTNAQEQAIEQAEDLASQRQATERQVMTLDQCLEQLKRLQPVVTPMLEACAEQYADMGRPGYPQLVDTVERSGVFGINLDPGFGAYFMTDGESVYAEIHRVALRTDTLSAANYEKFSGSPVQERIELDP